MSVLLLFLLINKKCMKKINRDFKGVWISKEMIKIFGWKNAILISSYKQGAPNLSKNDLRKIKKLLNKKLSPSEIKNKVINIKGTKKCSWCKQYCYITEFHHYPIKRSEGGLLKEEICGKCHSDFHFLQNIEGK